MTDANTTSTTTIGATSGPTTVAGDTIEQLIATFRELNLRIRPLPESQLSTTRSNTSIKRVVQELRDRETSFAQSLKEWVTKVPTDGGGGAPPVIGLETDEDSTAMLISQFGSARGTTLSLLKSLPEASWTSPISDGGSILTNTQELVAHDKTALEKISSLLKP